MTEPFCCFSPVGGDRLVSLSSEMNRLRLPRCLVMERLPSSRLRHGQRLGGSIRIRWRPVEQQPSPKTNPLLARSAWKQHEKKGGSPSSSWRPSSGDEVIRYPSVHLSFPSYLIATKAICEFSIATTRGLSSPCWSSSPMRSISEVYQQIYRFVFRYIVLGEMERKEKDRRRLFSLYHLAFYSLSTMELSAHRWISRSS